MGHTPAEPDYAAPLTLNRFAYVLSNLTNFVDLTGEWPGCGICGRVIDKVEDVVEGSTGVVHDAHELEAVGEHIASNAVQSFECAAAVRATVAAAAASATHLSPR